MSTWARDVVGQLRQLQQPRAEPVKPQDPAQDPTAFQMGKLGYIPERKVAPVTQLPQFSDGFDKLPQKLAEQLAKTKRKPLSELPKWEPSSLSARAAYARTNHDGFEPARRRPVDLSGGAHASVQPELPQAKASRLAATGFNASLEDLAVRLGGHHAASVQAEQAPPPARSTPPAAVHYF